MLAKFKNWQEKMGNKSESQKHGLALSISFSISAIVLFFVISGWYLALSGQSLVNYSDLNFLQNVGKTYNSQKESVQENYTQIKNTLQNLKI